MNGSIEACDILWAPIEYVDEADKIWFAEGPAIERRFVWSKEAGIASFSAYSWVSFAVVPSGWPFGSLAATDALFLMSIWLPELFCSVDSRS